MEKGHHPQGREGVNSLIFNPVNAEATATAERKQVVVVVGGSVTISQGSTVTNNWPGRRFLKSN